MASLGWASPESHPRLFWFSLALALFVTLGFLPLIYL
jgi:hypothetical protein